MEDFLMVGVREGGVLEGPGCTRNSDVGEFVTSVACPAPSGSPITGLYQWGALRQQRFMVLQMSFGHHQRFLVLRAVDCDRRSHSYSQQSA